MTGDLSYAVRSLSRRPGFTIAAILTLSIGIGATTAIYSVVETILLRVAIGFTGVSLLASYVPARRATEVEPVVALRYE